MANITHKISSVKINKGMGKHFPVEFLKGSCRYLLNGREIVGKLYSIESLELAVSPEIVLCLNQANGSGKIWGGILYYTDEENQSVYFPNIIGIEKA